MIRKLTETEVQTLKRALQASRESFANHEVIGNAWELEMILPCLRVDVEAEKAIDWP